MMPTISAASAVLGSDLDGSHARAGHRAAGPPLAQVVEDRRAGGLIAGERAEEHPLPRPEAGGVQPARPLRRGVDTERPLAQVELGLEVILRRDRPDHQVRHGQLSSFSMTSSATL
jgi:hypothetical protein